eukprot:5915248-Prymnesium_polylepis.1
MFVQAGRRCGLLPAGGKLTAGKAGPAKVVPLRSICPKLIGAGAAAAHASPPDSGQALQGRRCHSRRASVDLVGSCFICDPHQPSPLLRLPVHKLAASIMSLSDSGCPLPAQQPCRSSAAFSHQATTAFNPFVPSDAADHARERGDLSSHQLVSTPDSFGPFIRASADKAARPTPTTSLNGSRVVEAENSLATQCRSSRTFVASEYRGRIASPRRTYAAAVDKRHDEGDDNSSEASSINSDSSEGSKGASVDLLLRRSDGAVDLQKHQSPTIGFPVRMQEGTTAREEA